MKFKKLAALTLAGAMSLSLAACGAGSPSAATDTPAPEGEVYKIGVLAPEVTHGWSAGVAYYAEKRCDELVAEGKIEKKILISGDAAEMTTQLDELKTWGADAIVAFPQWEGMEVPIQQAIDEGITVVNFDIAIEADGVYRVSGDNEGMGKDAAEYIIDKVGTEGTVVVLDVPTSGSVAELRKKGFTETMAAEAPNPQIDAVFSMDDETSIGALQAIRDAGRTDIKVITGGGGCQEWFNMMLADENQDIWLQSDLYSPVMVEDAVDMALDILNGNAPEDPVKIIPTERVDRENSADYLDENSPY